ncbi:Plastid lipid-associated protein/fibrillin conserved domain - like 2 [Theobroma cacao]|nr:Plastid lipid-associated protein/fibrillin conserved domain - like 2 [Theobroma cacao]
MELAFAASVYPGNGKRAIHEIKTKPLRSKLFTTKKRSFHNKFLCSVAVAPDGNRVSEVELENKKHDLLRAVQETQRGLIATADQRSIIEEALVSVEGYNMGAPIDLVVLDGTWRLQYTSALDVLILLEAAARLPFFQVGQIFQKFECRDRFGGGVIRNVVRWSIPNLLEEQEGATLVVSAKFDVVSVRNIYLQFEEVNSPVLFLETITSMKGLPRNSQARKSCGGDFGYLTASRSACCIWQIKVQDINISEQLQALIAPALLPRSFLSLQILQFLRTFRAQVPVRNPGTGRRSVGGLYYLSYLDRNMLLGRAVGGGGVFVFTKAQPLEL